MNLTTPSIIFRHQSETNIGIQTIIYGRNAIGYIEQGRMLIHLADRHITVESGELFHLNKGTHYIEYCPESSGHPFIQTLFFYTPTHLHNDFISTDRIDDMNRTCSLCRNFTHIYTYPAWPIVSHFFESLNKFISSQIHISNPELGHLKLCELIQLLLTQPGCCICRPVFISLSNRSQSLQDIVKANILTGISLLELSRLCGMSLSMFKNEFRKNFQSSPHKWLNEQRLTHARLQLISSSRSILDISLECRFNNPSHFIKLFKERFGITPSRYRHTYEH